ncbi:disulfide bond formation protein B [Pseudomonas fluorescens ABAC62]|nr:disulfide bond formation protein B [Pseudomonas fluorescens ABAC62]
MSLAPSRSLFFLAFMAGVLTLGASFYLEFGASLRPCFLCQIQRVFLAAFTFINLVGVIHNPRRPANYLYGLASMACALLGAVCVMLDNLSIWQALRLTVRGTVDCVEINWTLFDLSLPEWSLLFFLGMLILGGIQFSRLFFSRSLLPAER